MDWIDRVCAAAPRCSGGVDARELAALGEMGMARAPLRRLTAGVGIVGGWRRVEEVVRDEDRGRGRPGKRW
jgi:hypothetical protein